MKHVISSFLLYMVIGFSNAQSLKKHRITPYSGIEFYRLTDNYQFVKNGFAVSYQQGDDLRTPVGLCYEYRLKPSVLVGLDVTYGYRGISVYPTFHDPAFGYSGPVQTLSNNMLTTEITGQYSRSVGPVSIGLKGGLGAMVQPRIKDNTDDYKWYKNAPDSFYTFAPVVTVNALRNTIPCASLTFEIHINRLSVGFTYRQSLLSPIRGFDWRGNHYYESLMLSTRFAHLGYCIPF